jgi:hypothetical protein
MGYPDLAADPALGARPARAGSAAGCMAGGRGKEARLTLPPIAMTQAGPPTGAPGWS